MASDLSLELTREWSLLSPQDIIRRAYAQFPIVLTTHLEAESAAVLYLATRVVPDIPIVCLRDDTFHEEYAKTLQRALQLNLHVYDYTGDKLAALVRYCRALGAEALMHGIRRYQTQTRRDKRIVEYCREDGLYRVHPILDWTAGEVEKRFHEHQLPRHPILQAGAVRNECGIHCYARA